MKQIFTLLFLLVVGLGTLSRARAGQDYAPQPGETVIRFDIENRGSIFVRLYTKEAPNTSAQVLSLVRRGFYNEQKFFRVERRPKPYIAMFGDPQTKTMELDHPNVGSGGSGKTVPFESNSLTQRRGQPVLFCSWRGEVPRRPVHRVWSRRLRHRNSSKNRARRQSKSGSRYLRLARLGTDVPTRVTLTLRAAGPRPCYPTLFRGPQPALHLVCDVHGG
jgi:cyclophilin family peptidyl-prolyl cis-trans isomerase